MGKRCGSPWAAWPPREGSRTQARKLIFEGLALSGELIHAVIMTGHLRFLAIVANQQGRHELAARLAGAEAAWRDKVGGRVLEREGT